MTILHILTLPFGDPFTHFSTDGETEQWLAEVSVDMAAYGSDHFAASLAAEVLAAGGAVPTFSVRMGGTSHAADGAAILTLTPGATPAAWTALLVSAALVTAHGSTLLKLTGKSDIAGQVVEVASASLLLGLDETPLIARYRMNGQGEDIWSAHASASGAPEYVVTSSGDWASVSGREAVQQSLIRRFLTTPGDYRVNPTYGAGLLAAVKKRMRRSDMDDITRRIRQQALADLRVRAVSSLKVESLSGAENGIRYTITVDLVADGAPLTFSQEVV
jgi:hypothetical protein